MAPIAASGVYPPISRPTSGPVAMISPGFPTLCPVCHAPRTGLIAGGAQTAKRCVYACGGGYGFGRVTSIGDRVVWVGRCGSPQKPAS